MYHILLKGWLLIVVGAATIGIGGVLTSLGWNCLSDRARMQDLVRAVAREVEINEVLWLDPLFCSEVPDVLQSRGLYPRFRSSAANAVLVSGLFGEGREPDRTFLRCVAAYGTSIQDCNARLEASEQLVILKEKPASVEKHRRILRASAGFALLKQQHNAMAATLRKAYPTLVPKPFLLDAVLKAAPSESPSSQD